MENESPLQALRIAFIGKLGGTTKKDALQIVRDQGGIPLEKPTTDADWVVLGADSLPSLIDGSSLPKEVQEKIDIGQIELISETDFWHRLGLVEVEQSIRQLYTPAMLAELLEVSVRDIRRWRKLGLIQPVKEIHRLPYFDFQEVVSARRLAELLAQGTNPQVIESALQGFTRFCSETERPLSQLSLLVEGKQVLLRREQGIIEPRGQLRIDFDSLEDSLSEQESDFTEKPTSFKYPAPGELRNDNLLSSYDRATLLEDAGILEENGELEDAIAIYRLVLAHDGPSAELCFQLAELLYRSGNISAACERYFMAIELDCQFVEARANLGCVLSELGQKELAIAVFQGALELHADYSDVHLHLAETLEELGRYGEARTHWANFLRLTPNSPWAQDVRARLQEK